MATQELTLASEVEVREPCAECGGKGLLPDVRNHCAQCGMSHTQEALVTAGDRQPCGHSWGDYREVDGCSECGGYGHITRRVTLGDLVTFFAAQLSQRVACEHARPTFTTTRK